MVKVRVVLRGLVDLVSDGSPRPGLARLLMPNAEIPNAPRIPPLLRFTKRHTARLLLRHGERVGGVHLASPDPPRCGDRYAGINLMGKEVVLKPEMTDTKGDDRGLTVDRGPVSDPPGGGLEHSAHYVGKLETLLGQAQEDLGGIDPNLKGGYGPAVAEWLAARVVLTSGELRSTALWSDAVKGYKKVAFQVMPPPPFGSSVSVPEVYMAAALCVTGEIAAEHLTVRLTALATGDPAGELQVKPDDTGEIHLIIENAPEDCMHHDNHFLAHYWLRQGRDRVKTVFTPSAAGWAHGAEMDPQCSPGDNDG